MGKSELHNRVITFENENETPIDLQIELWGMRYVVAPGETFKLVFSCTGEDNVHIISSGTFTRIFANSAGMSVTVFNGAKRLDFFEAFDAWRLK